FMSSIQRESCTPSSPLTPSSASRPYYHPDLHPFLHDALPISLVDAHDLVVAAGRQHRAVGRELGEPDLAGRPGERRARSSRPTRSEEHTSELQSRVDLVCRLLLVKKKANVSRKTAAIHMKSVA